MFKTVLGFALLGLIFLSTLGLTVSRATKPEFLNEQSRRANLYGRASDNLPKYLPENFLGTGFTKEDSADIIRTAVDSETFYSFTDQYTDAHLTWLTGETNELNFQYSLESVKQNGQEKAVDRLLAKYDNLPICDDKQIKVWSATNGLPVCKLPASNVRSNDVANLFRNQVSTAFAELPDEITSRPTPSLEFARIQLSRTMSAFRYIWGATFVLLALIFLIYRRRSLFPLAFVFLFSGAVLAAFGFVAWDWVGRLISDRLPDNELVPLLTQVIATALEVLKTALGNISLILLFIGAAFLVLGIFYRPKSKGLTIPSR